MFCDEPIIAVYEGAQTHLSGVNAFLDCYNKLAYHITDGYRIILETENFYISLSTDGITKSNKKISRDDFLRAGEFIESFAYNTETDNIAFIDYAFTLFVGERLLDIHKKDGYYQLEFDDFDLTVIPHTLNESDFPTLKRIQPFSYLRVLGAERHITQKCACGGEGELLLNFVADYVVKCKSCNKSTHPKINAIYAIEHWNNGEIQCDLSDITIE